MPPAPAQSANAVDPNLRALLARVTRDQGPEFEQALAFTALATVSTPTSLRTDRKIKFLDIHWRGRITNAGTGPTLRTAPPLLGTQLFALIQSITVRGQHLRYGAQTPFTMRGESLAELLAMTLPNYIPQYTVTNSAGGTNGRSGVLSATAAATIDVDFVLPIPLVPLDVSSADMSFYALHGPDWPGNLYVDIQCADGTALASANPPTTFTAFGVGTGSPTMEIHAERPLLSKDFMARIRPAIVFHTTYTGQPTAAVSGASGSGVKLADLTVGKDTSRIFLKTGVAGTGTSAGVVTYGSLSDGIVTRTFFQLDNRQLRFQNANADSLLQDYMARNYGRVIPVGYKMIDFISSVGIGPANPKAAFPSSKLTAARKFEFDGDVTASANQISEVMQEMILGRPALV